MVRHQSLRRNYTLLLFLVVACLSIAVQSHARQARVGIFPGSFDPIHRGHLEVARSALLSLNLDAVYFIPNASNPNKQKLTTLEFRADIIKKTLEDSNEPKLHLFPLSLIRKADRTENSSPPPIRLLKAARQKFPEAIIYQILGSDSFYKVQNSKEAPGDRWVIAICRRPGDKDLDNKIIAPLEKKGLVKVFDSSLLANISSTKVRKAFQNGNFSYPQRVLSPGAYAYIVKSGAYEQTSLQAWLNALIHLPSDALNKKQYPRSEPIVIRQNYNLVSTIDLNSTPKKTRPPHPEVLEIKFQSPHSLGDLKQYLADRLTPLGMKVLAHPRTHVLIFPGNQEQLSRWFQEQEISSGLKITRNRSYITLGIHLAQRTDGEFLAVLDEVYGHDRLLHTEALVAGALELGGKKPEDFKIISDPADSFPTPMDTVYREALSAIEPGKVDAAIIGFHWAIIRDLNRRFAIWKDRPTSQSVQDGLRANISGRSTATWPRRHIPNHNLPYSLLAFKNEDKQPRTVLLTRNVYGDQLTALLRVLIEEKNIRTIILFGNAGGIGQKVQIGQLYAPTFTSRDFSTWEPVKNIFAQGKSNLPGARVRSVFSPIQETTAFLTKLQQSQANLVDVESGYIPTIQQKYANKNIRFGSIVLVSDLPGSKETLNSLESREKALEKEVCRSTDLILESLRLAAPGTHPLPLR